MKNLIRRFLNWFRFSEEQKKYLKDSKGKFNINTGGKNIAIQIQGEYGFLKRFVDFSNNYSHSIIGLNLDKPHYSILDIVFPPIYLLKAFEQFFLKQQQHNFHRKLNVSNFLYPNYNIFKTIKYFPKAFILFLSLKEKKDILQIKYENILIGDLIYDTYLRYFKKKTVNVKDLNLVLMLARTFYEINYLESISKKIDMYITGYTTYTNNGLPSRIFTKNEIEVYTFANFVSGKRLILKDFSQFKKYWDYKKDFSILTNKKEKIVSGLELLNNRINGVNDLKYMRFNTYLNKDQIEDSKFEGVIFLHDFTDSSHVYRWSLFEDFYEWFLFLINIIKKSNLNIGLKPHPNQNITSKKIVDKLKREYHDLNWIDERIPNSYLFSSGIKFGISVYGTVLSELAYKKIMPICCGDNPTINYNFTFNAKTKVEYEDFIINYNKL
ncbi:hypothetical protein N9C46_05650, partial [Flavobacteriaceae bacterium]|nr:hypothetical protein [Flavobacteriaceae bacterium]